MIRAVVQLLVITSDMAFSGFIIFSLFIFISTTAGFISQNACGDWEPYKEEKCLKIFEEPGLSSYEDAENYCAVEEAHLISIGLVENQNFVKDFFKSKQVADNVWIGLKYLNESYQWSDGTESHYSNWAEGSPKNLTDHCVQFQTDDIDFGKWSDVLCTKKNLVVCEKLQLWSLTYLQTIVMDLQYNLNVSQLAIKELETELKDLQDSLSEVKDEVSDISENPFPIGFIYAQLPDQKAPSEIWSWMQWEDVSSDYAGLFFRVVGGDSASFGTSQGGNAPRITKISSFYGRRSNISTRSDSINVYPGATSDILTLWGDDYGQDFQVVQSGGEVRPINKAIKIWRRKG